MKKIYLFSILFLACLLPFQGKSADDEPEFILSIEPYLNFGATEIGDFGILSFDVICQGFTGLSYASVSAPFAVSLDGETFSDTVYFSSPGTTIYVRYTPTEEGSDSHQLHLTCPDVTSKSINTSGSGFICDTSIPYTFYTFDHCWTIEDGNNDGNTFYFSPSRQWAIYYYHSVNPADDWLISPVFQLDGNQILRFDYWTANFNERFQVVALGIDTVPLTPVIETSSTAVQSLTLDLSSLNGSYRIGFHCTSDPDMYLLYISNFNLWNLQTEINFHPTSVAFPATVAMSSSEPQQTVITTVGSQSSPITLSVTTPFEISTDGLTFGETLTLQRGSNHILTDTILIRFSPTTYTDSTIQGCLTGHYAGVQDSITLSGTVFDCENTIPYTYNFNNSQKDKCWTLLDANHDGKTFLFNTSNQFAYYIYHTTNPADDWLISPDFQFDGDQYGFFEFQTAPNPSYKERFQVFAFGEDTIPLTPVIDTVTSQWCKQLLNLSELNGSYKIGIHCISAPDMYYLRITNFNILPIAPELSILPDTLTYRLTPVGDTTLSQQFLVNTQGAYGPITITAPEHFEVSSDGVTFGSTLTIPASSAKFRLDTVLVRFVPTTAGTFSAFLTISCSGMSDSIVLEGSARDCNAIIPLPLEESFEGEFNYCWKVVDQDGFGETWSPYTSYKRTGAQSVRSMRFYDDYSGENYLDNWLISPPIQLTDSALLTFYIRSSYEPNFSVYISTTGNAIEDFTTVLYENNFNFGSSSTFFPVILPLHQYIGQTVYIAFRHYNASNTLYLDDVSIATPQQHPLIVMSEFWHNFYNVGIGEERTVTTDVTGIGLSGDITATVNAPFTLSIDGTSYSNTVALPAGGGTLYIRFSPTYTTYFSQSISFSSPGADNVNFSLSGSGINCYNTIPYSHYFNTRNDCWETVNINDNNNTFRFLNSDVANSYAYLDLYNIGSNDDWLISPTLPLDGNQYGFFEYKKTHMPVSFQVFAFGADTVQLTDMIVVDNENNRETIRFDLSPLNGSYRIGIHALQTTYPSTLYIYDFHVQNITPILEFKKDTLDLGNYLSNTNANPVSSAILSTVGIQTPITISITGSFEISLNGTDYNTSLTIPARSTNVSYDTLFVRINPDGDGAFSGLLTAMSGDKQDSVFILGNIFDCPNNIPYSYSFDNAQQNNCWTVLNVNNDNRTFGFDTTSACAYYGYNSYNAADDWLISPVFHLNGNLYGSFDYRARMSSFPERFEVFAFNLEDTVILVPPTLVSSSSFNTQLLDLSGLNGDYQIGIHCISDMDQYYFYVKDFTISHFVPTLTVNEEEVNFGESDSHVLPGSQELVITGTGVFAPITVTAPTGYEVSADGVTYSGSMVIPAHSNGFTTDTFYVRFNPATEGFYDGLLIVSATSCADTVQLHGSIFYCGDPLTLPYTEDFEDALSTCWLILDYDGDQESWIPTTDIPGATGHQSANAYASLANTGIAYNVYQQNFLVTPMFVPTENTVLAFFTMGSEGIPQNYEVYVSNENTLTAIHSGTPVISATAEVTWKENAISLADYAGDSIYVAFEHYDKNQGALYIDDIVITDNLDHAIVLVDSNSLSFGSVVLGENAVKQLEITAFGLQNSTTAFSSIHYQLSVDGTNFTQVVTIPADGGTLYVRYTPSSEEIEEGTVTLFVPGSQSITVALSGNGFDCLNTIPYSYQFNDNRIFCWNVENNNGDNRTFEFDTLNNRAHYYYSYQNAADDWLISPTFQFNGNQYGHFDYYCLMSNYPERFEVKAIGADTIDLVAPVDVANTSAQTLYLDFTGLTGEYAIGIHCISDADQFDFSISDFHILNVTPSITVEQDSLEFTLTPLNGTSSSQAVVVSSIGVTTPITATAPTSFEVSSDNLNFGHSVTIPAVSDLLAHDTFYVRFAPTVAGLSENTLTITTGSLQETVALSGISRDCDEALTLPFFESFEGPDSYCWTSFDEDGDGFSWDNDYTGYTHSGSQSANSASYVSETGALHPDNWLVSQPIQLPEIPARLSFWVKETYVSYSHEHYSVYVSTTGSAPADFTDVVFTGDATSSFEQQSVSLRDYAGQTVRIAFRHHNSYDVFRLVLDDIDIRLDTVLQLPIVVTDSVFSITQMSAVCIGHTVFDGNSPVTASGFVWSTSPEPTVADNVVNATPGLPTMIGMLNGLSEHHTYYMRAFATNSIGTEYGEEVVFTTLCGPATYTNFNQAACESFTWNDSTYFESGDYTQQFSNMIGCDSIVTMHLTVHHGNSTAFSVTECESYTWNNVIYEQSGDYTQSFTNIHGCDSTVTLHLTIHHGDSTAFSISECNSYTWNGTEYQQSGDYNQTFANIHGCDSVVTLHLTLNYATSTEFADTACNVYAWNDSVYSETGDYVQHFETVHGCDSTVTLHLTIHNSDSTEFAATECESYVWNDTTYTQSGDYNQTFANIHDCDSVVTLHLTIHHGDTTEFAVAECESYVWNDTTYTLSGDYTRTFANIHGCDSVVTLHLTVYPAVSSEETVAWPDSCYIWNGEEFCESGSYTQTLTTVHGCDSTVTLHLTITVGVEDFVMDNDLRVYPNPTNGLLNVSGTAFTDVQLFDAYGKLVGRWHTNGDVTQIDLSQHATGIYFVKVLNRNQVIGVKKVLKR